MLKEKISYLYITLTVLIWSSTAAAAKLLLKNLDSFQILLYISLFGTISLFIVSLLQKKIKVIKKYKFEDYCIFALMGFLGVFLYHVLLFTGLSIATAQEVFIVNYTWPIWVVIFAIFFIKEKLNVKKTLGIIICFFGVYIVITQGDLFSFSGANIKGVLFALNGAVSYGLFSVLGRKYKYEVFTSMMFYFGFSFVYSIIATLLFSNIPVPTLFEILGLIWLGVFAIALAFVFWFLALKYGNIVEMSKIVYLTPFISLIYINLLLGEEILLFSFVGLIIIIIGILLNNNINLRKKEERNYFSQLLKSK